MLDSRKNCQLQHQYYRSQIEDILVSSLQKKAQTSRLLSIAVIHDVLATKSFRRAIKGEASRVLQNKGCSEMKQLFRQQRNRRIAWQLQPGHTADLASSKPVKDAVARLLSLASNEADHLARIRTVPTLPTITPPSPSRAYESYSARGQDSSQKPHPPAVPKTARAPSTCSSRAKSSRSSISSEFTPPTASPEHKTKIVDELKMKLYSNLGRQSIAHAFCAIDLSRSGHITYEDFRECVKRLNISGGEDDIFTLFNMCDRSGKGIVSFDDFKAFLSSTVRTPIFINRPDTPPAQVKLAMHKDDHTVVRELSGRVDPAHVLRDKIQERGIYQGDVLRAFHPPEKHGKPEFISLEDFRKGARHLGVILSRQDLGSVFGRMQQQQPGIVKHETFAKFIGNLLSPHGSTALNLRSERPGFRKDLTEAEVPKLASPALRHNVFDSRLKLMFKGRGHLLRSCRLFDQGSKGALSLDEFTSFCRRGMGLNMSTQDFVKLHKSLDPKKKGAVDYRVLISNTFPSSEISSLPRSSHDSKLPKERSHHQNDIQKVGKHVNLQELLLDKIESRATGHCNLQRAFKMFDTTASQDITPTEFEQAMDRVGMNVAREDCHQLFSRYDSDNDGVINYREFINNVMKRKTAEVSMLMQMNHEKAPIPHHAMAVRMEKAIKADETEAALRKMCQQDSRTRHSLERSFQKKDSTDEGVVTFPDLVKILKGVSTSANECRPIYERYIDNGTERRMNYKSLLQNLKPSMDQSEVSAPNKNFNHRKLSMTRELMQSQRGTPVQH